MDDLVPIPERGRTFTERRRVRLTDMDPDGRTRFDAVARFLQEIAIDDVQETGWGTPDHLWFVRRMRIEVLEPLLHDDEVEIVTWCSALAALAAGRRWSLTGDRGGRIEVDSVWVHLDANQRPARIDGFDPYAEVAAGRRASSRLELPDPPPTASRSPWPLRVSDIDLHGHVNNTVYWQALEDLLHEHGPDPRRQLTAVLEFREPLDLEDQVELAVAAGDHRIDVGFLADGLVKAAARATTSI
jgi:acyl-ACP thioesterase